MFFIKDSTKIEPNKYVIVNQSDKREVKGTTYEELIVNIKEKYDLTDQFKIEYWSNTYQEWILMESLPENESKLQLIIEPKVSEPNLKSLINEELKTQLENSTNFSDTLNMAFKNYIETDDAEFLKHFEVAVIFACKRREQKQYFDIEEFLVKNVEQQQILKTLNDEMKKFQSSNKKFQVQLENLSQKLNSLELDSNKCTKFSSRHKKCIII